MSSVILLADDSPTIQKVLRLALSDSPYDLHVVDNGVDALKKIQEVHPDLVLADVLLPGKDGYQVCEEIKARKNIPVVLLYGAFESIDEKRLKRIGADGSLKKPFATQELFKLIRQLIKEYQVLKPQDRREDFLEEIGIGNSDLEELILREVAGPDEQTPGKQKKEDVDLSYLDEELIVPSRDKEAQKKEPDDEIKDTFYTPPITTDVKPADPAQVVQEAAREIIEKVAWEVVPAIAERIIREEVRKLLDEVE